MSADAYFASWAAIILGMGVGFLLAPMMKLGKVGSVIFALCLFGLAYATPRFGPLLLDENQQVQPTEPSHDR